MKKTILIILITLISFTTFASCKEKNNDDGNTNMKTGTNIEIDKKISAKELKFDENTIVGSQYSSLKQSQKPKNGDTIATFTTDEGIIRALIYSDKSPKAYENFVKQAIKGYYNGVIFHRVIPDFMNQSGDPTGTGTSSDSIWGKPFAAELNNDLYHFKGALAMASSPLGQGSQFYIVNRDDVDLSSISTYSTEIKNAYKSFGGTPQLDSGYSVFGQVFEGFDVIDAIEKVGSPSGAVSKKIIIFKIEISIFKE